MSGIRLAGAAMPLIHQLRRSQRERSRLQLRAISGRSVLSAADNPADMARGAHQNARIRSRRMAMRNVEDGVSALQTAEGGLARISELLGRLRELATQAASGTLVGTSRSALQVEFASVLVEIDRTATSTGFQGAELLSQIHVDIGFVLDTSGSMGAELAQVVGSITDMFDAFNDAGLDAQFGLASARSSLDPVDNVVRNVDIGGGGFLAALSAAASSIAGGAMDPYSALLNTSGANDFNGDGDSFSWREDAVRHLVYVTDTGQETIETPGNPSQADTAAAIATEGVAVHVIARTPDFGTYSTLTSLTGGTLENIGNAFGSGVSAAMDSITTSMIGGTPTEAPGPLIVQTGIDDTANDRLDIGVAVDATRVGLGLTGLDLSTAAGAGDALDAIDGALDLLNQQRAQIGATQSQLGFTFANHQNMLENEVEAYSRMIDFDYAQGMADLARADLLAEASRAMLARSLQQQRRMAEQMTRQLLNAS